MRHAEVRFYSELNDFLPPSRRQQIIPYTFNGSPSIKDVIEALGVPHAEVEVILVNGNSVDFSYRLAEGDQVSVYPVFESLHISPILRLRDQPLRNIRFVLDGHLHRLAVYLRLLGFDSLWRQDFADQELASISFSEKRVLLTRDIGLLKRKLIERGYWIRSVMPRDQIDEVLRRFDLFQSARPFERCLRCNSIIERIRKETVEERLKPEIRSYYSEFFECPGCKRVYWKGPHYRKMKELVQSVLSTEGAL